MYLARTSRAASVDVSGTVRVNPTMQCIHGLVFPSGGPTVGQVYGKHPLRPRDYLPYASYHRLVLHEKSIEAARYLLSLGARDVAIKCEQERGKQAKAEAGIVLPDAGDVSLGMGFGRDDSGNLAIRVTGAGKRRRTPADTSGRRTRGGSDLQARFPRGHRFIGAVHRLRRNRRPPANASTRQLIHGIVAIVSTEGTVLGDRLRTAYGGQRVGKTIAQLLDRAISTAVRNGLIVAENPLHGAGVSPRTYRLPDPPPVRVRTLGSVR